MKIRYEIGVGEAVFNVNRDGAETIVSIDTRLSYEQVSVSAFGVLDSEELAEFQVLRHARQDGIEIQKLGNVLATVSRNP